MQVPSQEKEIIKSNISNITKFIKSSNEDTQNYLLFNEKLFLNHNKWLENIKSQINRSIRNCNETINFQDINNDKETLNLIKKIVKPNNYRNFNEKNMNKEEILETIDKLTDFNDIITTVNTCSKLKRDSLIAKIHNNNINNEINININDKENSRITFKENNDNENNKLIDEDIMIEDIISSTQKVKLDSGSNELEKEGNSLCTIMEQPSLEEMKKSIFSTNIMPNTNTIEEKNKTGNYVLELNNNMTNMSNPIINKSANNQNYKPLKLSESIITPKKDDNNINNINNNNTPANKGYAINIMPQFSFNKKGQQLQENNNSNINNNTNSNIKIINSKNEITFAFSSNKKLQSQKKDNIITTPTLNPKNNNNFINIITTTINKINEEKYLDDFEEYEMSDSSQRDDEEDDDDELNIKFKPKWALDKEYINRQLQKQKNNPDLIIKSFGKCFVERLNLNMLFGTHYEVFDVRNSTADWKGDDSLAKSGKNKINDENNNDINNIFPNRKLQFV